VIAAAVDKPDGAGAAIRLSADGRFLYVSGRSNSEIAAFAIDAASGALSPVQRVPTDGLAPRDFDLTPDGRFVVIANQQSNTLTSLWRNPDTGRHGPTGQAVELGSPVCVLF